MKINAINELFFSATGTTQKIVSTISSPFDCSRNQYDLLKAPLTAPLSIAADTLTVIGAPVYAGRVPAICAQSLQQLRSEGGPAIVAVAYGNREYDDALLELRDIAKACGFEVIAAGAFIAQHSIFPEAGKNRPDAEDIKCITAFANRCGQILEQFESLPHEELVVKGNSPYKEAKSIPLKPTGNKDCTQCGACVAICPTGSISKESPRKTKEDTCISCAACIHICPEGARGFHTMMYKVANKAFLKNNAAYKMPETFFI